MQEKNSKGSRKPRKMRKGLGLKERSRKLN